MAHATMNCAALPAKPRIVRQQPQEATELNLVLVPLLIAAASCPPARSAVLVGRWEAQRVSKGGVGHVMDFRNDGSFVQSTAVTLHLPRSGSGGATPVGARPARPPF